VREQVELRANLAWNQAGLLVAGGDDDLGPRRLVSRELRMHTPSAMVRAKPLTKRGVVVRRLSGRERAHLAGRNRLASFQVQGIGIDLDDIRVVGARTAAGVAA